MLKKEKKMGRNRLDEELCWKRSSTFTGVAGSSPALSAFLY
jgi:hypothetical protein